MSKLYNILNSLITRVKKVETNGSDWNAFEGEAGYVKNRTHYEETTVVNEPLNITWDGNTEGLVSVADYYYKVSDDVFTNEQIKIMISTVSNGERNITADMGAMWDAMVNIGDVTEDLVALSADWMGIIVRKAGADVDGLIFQETGVYFAKEKDDFYMSSLTTTEPVERTKTVVKKLDPKFIQGGTVLCLDFDFNNGEEQEFGTPSTRTMIENQIASGGLIAVRVANMGYIGYGVFHAGSLEGSRCTFYTFDNSTVLMEWDEQLEKYNVTITGGGR